jgi:hypothetical protein
LTVPPLGPIAVQSLIAPNTPVEAPKKIAAVMTKSRIFIVSP